MNIPKFTAEASVYKSSGHYMARGVAGSPSLLVATPAAIRVPLICPTHCYPECQCDSTGCNCYCYCPVRGPVPPALL